jgi:hypothetical protein
MLPEHRICVGSSPIRPLNFLVIAVMVRRLSEFKQKLHPNPKLRAWYHSHTFGGTTKARSLKILGFSKQNFYYVAAGVGALFILAGVVAAVGVKNSLRKAKTLGAVEGVVGQQVIISGTQTRTRTFVSDGKTVLKTETSAALITSQRGGGVTELETTNSQGEATTVAASLLVITDEGGNLDTRTYIGSPIFVPGLDGVSEQTVVFGDPTIVTGTNGQQIETTVFADLTMTTDDTGQTVTNVKSSSQEATLAPGDVPTATDASNTAIE